MYPSARIWVRLQWFAAPGLLSGMVLAGAVSAQEQQLSSGQTPDLNAAQRVIAEATDYLRGGAHGVGGTWVPVYYPRTPLRDRIEAALAKPVDLEFIDTEVAQALSFLSDRYQIPIRWDLVALTEHGVGLDTELNLVLSGVTLQDALELLLEPLDLDCCIRQDVLHVTTCEQAAGQLESRLYDLRRFPNEFTTAAVAQVLRGTVQPDSWRPDTTARPPSPPAGPAAPAAAVNGASPVAVANATSPVAPLVRGSMEVVPGGLLIAHNQRTHREIAAVLEQLARFLAAVPGDAAAGAAATAPPAVLDLERAARQIVRLQGVITPLQAEIQRQDAELKNLQQLRDADRQRLLSEVANWEETHRRTLQLLEEARAEIARLKALSP